MRAAVLCLLSLATAASRGQTPYDIVITNGRIIDGTGSPWYSGQLGIRDGHIAAIGNLEASPRKQTIDAHGIIATGKMTGALSGKVSRGPGYSGPR